MAKENDFYVEAIAYNAYIMRRLVECKLVSRNRASVMQLVQKIGRGFGSNNRNMAIEQDIRKLVGLRMCPTEEDGSWKPIALDLAKALEIEPDKLWPGDLKHQIPASASRVLYSSVGEPVTWLVMAKK